MIRRHITGHLLQALEDTPAVLVNCARQTGKSTLVQSAELMKQSRQYLRFDDPGVLAAAKRDPNGFIAGLNTPVTLDEVQHVPELFPVIKVAIDRKRKAGRFLLTGSANVMLLPKLSESLADAHLRLQETAERMLLGRAIELANGNRAKAARWQGISRLTLRKKLVQYGLQGGIQ